MAEAKKTTKKTKKIDSNKEVANKVKKALTGLVVSQKTPNTATVRVESKYPHPKYGKIVKKHKKYLVHFISGLEVVTGDTVVITETKPKSKNKSWEILNKIES